MSWGSSLVQYWGHRAHGLRVGGFLGFIPNGIDERDELALGLVKSKV